ncbi:protein phosphatase 2C domain-containing protein [Acidicapsa dinghuensis]|uniref:Protein phosphatase 2C domain-containing protein n=1 Tax=Acidicapsa dinghuensis TaxID=2218256 RepID=A0ABW1ELV2_9BACT|nr:protein phosphatase 2C domain-containing protein [Acidicapsa dinghuensis]
MSNISAHGALNISFGEICDRGKVREENQDSVRNASIPLGELFIVADGIGGYQGGATASRMVVEGFYAHLASRPEGYPASNALIEACTATNAAIYDRANSGDPAFQRMGSTVVLALVQPVPNSGAEAWIGHVGDSRAYLVHNGQMHKITNDHSAVQALMNKGLITEEEARNHPDASVLTRSLGHRPEVEIEIDHILLQPGDSLLLCSDGLWGYVHDADFATVATDPSLSVQTAARLMLDQALAAGGPDNIGIEFIRIEGGAPISPALPRPIIPTTAPAGPISGAIHIPPKTSNKLRTLELIALALLLIGGSGYLVFAHQVGNWPFNSHKPVDTKSTETPTQPTANQHVKPDASSTKSSSKSSGRHSDNGHPAVNQPTAQPTSGPGSQQDDEHAGQPAARPSSDGGNHHETLPSNPPQTQPNQEQPNHFRRSVVIVGDPRNRHLPEPSGDLSGALLIIKHESRPECLALAKDHTVIYHHKSGNASSPLDQYPVLKGHLGEHSKGAKTEELTPEISQACGQQYDIVVILARTSGQDAQPSN